VFGWGTDPSPQAGYGYLKFITPALQAQWLVQAYQQMKAWDWMGLAFVWNLDFIDTLTASGLFHILGQPAFEALRARLSFLPRMKKKLAEAKRLCFLFQGKPSLIFCRTSLPSPPPARKVRARCESGRVKAERHAGLWTMRGLGERKGINDRLLF
jgi:hypothetical protein